jgi:hypothetical protein
MQPMPYASFQDYLLNIGEGGTGNIFERPDIMVAAQKSTESLIHYIFGDDLNFEKDAKIINNETLNFILGIYIVYLVLSLSMKRNWRLSS